MCGISGFLNLNNNFSHSDLRRFFFKYEFYFREKGPDSFGVWVEEKEKINTVS